MIYLIGFGLVIGGFCVGYFFNWRLRRVLKFWQRWARNATENYRGQQWMDEMARIGIDVRDFKPGKKGGS